ncbi:MAG TPA: hypothetical protein PLV45_00610 [bacterium]|nr:hypothetical protein [bacterium]
MHFSKKELKYLRYRTAVWPMYGFLAVSCLMLVCGTLNFVLVQRYAAMTAGTPGDIAGLWFEGIKADAIYEGIELKAITRFQTGLINIFMALFMGFLAYVWHSSIKTYRKILDLVRPPSDDWSQ